MPRASIVIGEEFLFRSIMNADETRLTVWVTVTTGTPQSPGRFTIRWDNESARSASLVMHRVGNADVVVNVPPGSGTFNAGSRQWTDWFDVNVIPVPRIRTPQQ